MTLSTHAGINKLFVGHSSIFAFPARHIWMGLTASRAQELSSLT